MSHLRLLVLGTGVGLISASAAADDFDLVIKPTKNLKNTFVAFALDSSSVFGPGSISLNYIQLTKGGKTFLADTEYKLKITFFNAFSLPVTSYTVLSEYVGTSSDGLTVGFNVPTGASLIATSAPWGFTVTEPTLHSALQVGNADQFDFVVHQLISSGGAAAVGSDLQLVSYSNASNGGTAKITAVPEPLSLSALAVGLIGFLRKRKA